MIAYLDCFAGISGDMTLGALLDLGVPIKWLQEELERLPYSGFRLKCESVLRGGIRAKQFSIEISNLSIQHNCLDACRIIEQCPYSQDVRDRGMAVFKRLTAAHERAHGTGDLDGTAIKESLVRSILVVMGSLLGFDYLGIDSIYASHLPVGRGVMKNQQEGVPVDTPTVLNILKGWPIDGGVDGHETVTSEGASILVSSAEYKATLPALTLSGVGHGAGTHDETQSPNLLRVITGEPLETRSGMVESQLLMLESCIDDMNPELYGYLMERLFENGALDVTWSPVYMKKNRPGTRLEVLCRQWDKEVLVACILNESTSLGVRYYEVKRQVLPRRIIEVETCWGTVAAKEVTGLDGRLRIIPEYEVCRRIAEVNKIPLRYVYEKFYGQVGT